MNQISATEILKRIDLGKSVAEQDDRLRDNFLEIDAYGAFMSGKCDIIVGNKGTGKTAIYKMAKNSHSDLEARRIFLCDAFHSKGKTNFEIIADGQLLGEHEYINIWKMYFYALIVHELVTKEYITRKGSGSEVFANLKLLGLESILNARSHNKIRELLAVIMSRAGKVGFAVGASGKVPVMGGEIQAEISLSSGQGAGGGRSIGETLNIDDLLYDVAAILEENNAQVWLVLDRLDEAFQGRQDLEKNALRALLRTYLDMVEHDSIVLKLFMRRDLFDRVVERDFVNLTHVNASLLELYWSPDDLQAMILMRLRAALAEFPGFPPNLDDVRLLDLLFPEKVENRQKQSKTWKWIMDRTADAKSGSPRNLIDFVTYAVAEQRKDDNRSGGRSFKFGTADSLLTGKVLKLAFKNLSAVRVKDTLLAESGDFSDDIESFRNGKAEHNDKSLEKIFGDRYLDVKRFLLSVGFFEELGKSLKVVFLYRDGLGILQGKDPGMK